MLTLWVMSISLVRYYANITPMCFFTKTIVNCYLSSFFKSCVHEAAALQSGLTNKGLKVGIKGEL